MTAISWSEIKANVGKESTVSINNGGPAFPRPFSTDEHENLCNAYNDQQGMTLRDWFAGQALAGWLSAPEGCGTEVRANPRKAAAWSYDYADAMLDEREQEK